LSYTKFIVLSDSGFPPIFILLNSENKLAN